MDARYKFIIVDIGSYGRNSDGGIFAHSSLGRRLENGTFNIPNGKYLPHTTLTAPYVIVGDEAFPLKTYLLRPYPGRQSNGDADKSYFNYRLSMARRLVENAFSILTQRFRIFAEELKWSQKMLTVILACCIPHNFLRERNDNTYLVHNIQDNRTQNSQSHAFFLPLTQSTRKTSR